MENNKKSKVVAYFSDTQLNYIKNEAEKMGISISAFVNVCVSNYMRENDMMATLRKIQEYIPGKKVD